MSTVDLAEVLAAHRFVYPTHCTCREWRAAIAGDAKDANGVRVSVQYEAHLAAAVTTWLTERLASDEVREAVIRGIYSDGLDGAPEIATAALTAVTEALRGPS